MKINVETIPHNEQRYATVGDWWFNENGDLEIRVSKMDNEDHELLIALHEIIEARLCLSHGISEKQVSDFDKDFERLRIGYPDIIGNEEPGNMVSSPYHKEHSAASRVELTAAIELGVNYDIYEQSVNRLI